jgi:linoleate 10R-lipoxygenase
MEGIRLNGTFGSYRRSAVETNLDDNGRSVHVKPGDKVFASFVGANREAEFFPEPDTVRIDRPMEIYIHYGLGPHACLGGEASRTALTAMLRVVGRLDNLRRAPGPQGQLKKIPRPGGRFPLVLFCFLRCLWGNRNVFRELFALNMGFTITISKETSDC